MRVKAGFIGIILLVAGWNAMAYTSDYSGIALPGEHNGWNTNPTFSRIGDGVWQDTVTLDASDKLKIVSFENSSDGATWWGGDNAIILRPDIRVSVIPREGSDITLTNLPPGDYLATFREATGELTLEALFPLPPPDIQSLHFIGDFTDWADNENFQFTQSTADPTLWELSAALRDPITFQFFVNRTNKWGSPAYTALTDSNNVTGYASGGHIFTFTPNPGQYHITFNASNSFFSISRTNDLPPSSAVAVLGSFAPATTSAIGNMRNIRSSIWEGTFDITNNGSITGICFTSGDQVWGGIQTLPLPASGTLTPGDGNTLKLTGATPGRYTVTFDIQSAAFTFAQAYTTNSGVNLLPNPSFELTASTNEYSPPLHWIPYPAGQSVRQTNYPSHSGVASGLLKAKTFNEWSSNPSFSYDVKNISANSIYTLSAWFRTLYGWDPSTPAYIRIEWLDSSGKNLDSPAVSSIANIAEDAWSFVSVEETAPDGAAKAHVVIMASDVGESGYLLVDDVELRESPTRLLNFNGISPSGDETNRVINGWETYGRIVYNIPPAAPTGGVFISQYVEGTGNNIAIEIFNGTASSIPLRSYALRQYNNGSTTPFFTIPLGGTNDLLAAGDCLVVSRPPIADDAYPPDSAITSPPAGLSLQTTNLTFNGDDVIALCANNFTKTIIDRIGTPGMTFDSITSRATRDRTLVRKNSSTAGTNSFTSSQWNTLPINTFSGLGEHSLTDPDAPYSPPGSAILLSNSTGFIQGGAFSGGIGDISFWYRAEPNADQTLFLSVSTDSTTWTNIASFNASTATNYTYFFAGVDSTQFKYVRITNSGTGAVRLDDISVSPQSDIPRLQPFESWTDPAFTSLGNYSLHGWNLDAGRIVTGQGVTASRAACLHTNGTLTTPAFADGIGEVTFWVRPINSDPEDTKTKPTLDVTLSIFTDNSSNWTKIAFFTNINQATTLSAWLYYTNNPTKARLSFNSPNAAHLLLDNVEARIPVLYRKQNFDSWPLKSSYSSGISTHQGWTINNCKVTATNAHSGLTAFLSKDTDAWIQSPRLPDGIGSISFVARKTASANPILKIQTSPNGTTWTDLATVKINTKTFIPFYYYCSNTTHHFVRIINAAGSTSNQIDDILIDIPAPRPSVDVTFGLDPAAPTAGNTASVIADIFPSPGVTVLSVTSSVKVSSNWSPGNWTNSPMTETSHPNAWRSSNTTAPLVKGRTIQSKVTVTYAGIGAASNSTGYSTNSFTTHIQTNRVSSVEKGQVWINEFSYLATADDGPTNTWLFSEQNHEFIELCGRTNTSIGNWTVELVFGTESDIIANTNQPIYASYKIPVGTVLQNETNGFGFYILGDVPSWPSDKVNQPFNTFVPDGEWIANNIVDNPGIIRLLDEYSNLVYSLYYGNSGGVGTSDAGQQIITNNSSVSLAGTGSVYTAFGWENTGGFSLREANNGQTLVPLANPDPAEVFHIPTKYVEPIPPSEEVQGIDPFYMRNPINAQNKDPLEIYFGFPYAGDGPERMGFLYHRIRSNGTWNANEMDRISGSIDTDNKVYAGATIPARFYPRGSTIEYFMETIPINGSAVSYIVYDADTGYKVLTDETAAKASPFTFTFQVHPEVFIDKFYVTNGSDWVFLTGGNETTGIEGGDPFTDFRIRYTANLLDDTNSWGEITNVSISEVDLYGSNIFTGYNGPTSTPLFFRIDPVW